MPRKKKEELQKDIQETTPVTAETDGTKDGAKESVKDKPLKYAPRSFRENIEYLSVAELLDYERMARIVCSRLESELKNYDGSIKTGSNYSTFHSYTTTYRIIVDEMERRVREWGY